MRVADGVYLITKKCRGNGNYNTEGQNIKLRVSEFENAFANCSKNRLVTRLQVTGMRLEVIFFGLLKTFLFIPQ